MKSIDIRGIPNMELMRGGTDEWYWGTDYIHGDLYEAEELFRDGHPVKSNRLYLIHYPDGTAYEPVPPVDGQYLGYPVYDGGMVALLAVNFAEQVIRILRFSRHAGTREITRLPLSEVKDCYNLILHTAPLSLTRSPTTVRLSSSGPSGQALLSAAGNPLISAMAISSISISGTKTRITARKCWCAPYRTAGSQSAIPAISASCQTAKGGSSDERNDH